MSEKTNEEKEKNEQGNIPKKKFSIKEVLWGAIYFVATLAVIWIVWGFGPTDKMSFTATVIAMFLNYGSFYGFFLLPRNFMITDRRYTWWEMTLLAITILLLFYYRVEWITRVIFLYGALGCIAIRGITYLLIDEKSGKQKANQSKESTNVVKIS